MGSIRTIKDWYQRTRSESIIYQSLVKLNKEYNSRLRFRCAGSIEAILVIDDYLDPDKPLPYQQYTTSILFGLFEKTTNKETYIQLITRLGYQYLYDYQVIESINKDKL